MEFKIEELRLNLLVCINTLNEIPIRGETDMKKMMAVIQLLKQTADTCITPKKEAEENA